MKLHVSKKKIYQNIDFDKFIERKSGRDDFSLFVFVSFCLFSCSFLTKFFMNARAASNLRSLFGNNIKVNVNNFK